MAIGMMPSNPKIYHLLHMDRLPFVLADGALWSDAQMSGKPNTGTMIGMDKIKQRRLMRTFACFPKLCVGQCVPFYFCPRSIMLYMMHKDNHTELTYHGGQEPIIRLEANLHDVVAWADNNGKRWVFTLSNAGANYFEDRNNLNQLNEINWSAVMAHDWRSCKEGKQAEFLIEECIPWNLISRIGVYSGVYLSAIQKQIHNNLSKQINKPPVLIKEDWYY